MHRIARSLLIASAVGIPFFGAASLVACGSEDWGGPGPLAPVTAAAPSPVLDPTALPVAPPAPPPPSASAPPAPPPSAAPSVVRR